MPAKHASANHTPSLFSTTDIESRRISRGGLVLVGAPCSESDSETAPMLKAQEVLGVRGEGLGRAVLRRSVHCTAASERKCSDLNYIVELTLIASMKVQILKGGYCSPGRAL